MIKKVNYLGFDHEEVTKNFEGAPTFVNYMNINDRAVAVYYSANPNREKNHKNYMLLFERRDPVLHTTTTYVSGMDLEDIKKHSEVDGMKCMKCEAVLYSLTRHDFHSCGCDNDMFVDGGVDYLRTGAKDLFATEHVKIDLLTDKVTIVPRRRK